MALNIIHNGEQVYPPRIFVYGEGGIGKTTFASQAPNPIFIPTEDGLRQIKVDSFPLATNYQQVISSLENLWTEKHDYKTVVIDSADCLEQLIIKQVIDEHGGRDIATVGGGYGRGYNFVKDRWDEIRFALQKLNTERNMAVIILAHSQTKVLKDPEKGEISQYYPAILDKSKKLLYHWVDAVLFATFQRGVFEGSSPRILRTNSSFFCEAKNRYNLDECIPLDWNVFCNMAFGSKE